MEKIYQLKNLHERKIMILDGAMGTMIQKEKLKENDFRNERFKNHKNNLYGNNDILNLTQQNLIYDILGTQKRGKEER